MGIPRAYYLNNPKANKAAATLTRWARKAMQAKKTRKAPAKQVKKIVTSMKPTKFTMFRNEDPDVDNSGLQPQLFPSDVLFTSTEADSHYKREGYKIRVMNMYMHGEFKVRNTSVNTTKLRLILVKGFRAGGLTTADIGLTQPAFVYTDEYLQFTNPKNCKVLYDHIFSLEASTAAQPAVYPETISFTKNIPINETWRYPSADPAFSPAPINPGSYMWVAISNQPSGSGPKVDLNCRLSFKDL